MGKIADLVTAKESSSRNSGERPAERVRTGRRNGHCGEIGQIPHLQGRNREHR